MNNEDLLLTPEEKHKLWKDYKKTDPNKALPWSDVVVEAQLAEAKPIYEADKVKAVEEAKKLEDAVVLLQLVERLGFEISEGHIIDGVGKSVGKANFEN